MTESQLILMFFLFTFIATVGVTVFLVKRSSGNSRFYWFVVSVIVSIYLIGYIFAPIAAVASLFILHLLKKDNNSPLADIGGGFVGLLSYVTGVGFFAMYALIAVGGLYWLWMAIQLGSFWMFALGIVPFAFIVTVPVGSYSLLFGIPDWVYSTFG